MKEERIGRQHINAGSLEKEALGVLNVLRQVGPGHIGQTPLISSPAPAATTETPATATQAGAGDKNARDVKDSAPLPTTEAATAAATETPAAATASTRRALH